MAISLVLWLVATLLLAYRWAGSLRMPLASQLVSFVLLGLALWLVPMQALGLVSLLTRAPVVHVPGAAGLVLMALVLDVLIFGRRSLDWRWREFAAGQMSRGELLLVALMAVVLGATLFFGLLHPPMGWDNQHYHLPRALNFLQRHTLTEYYPPAGYTLGHVENALGYNACHAYPGNWSLYLMLLALPRWEFLLTIAQFPFLLIGGLVVFRLARLLGASTATSWAAVACASTAPLVLIQGVVPYADLFCTAVILASVLFLFEPEGGKGAVAMAGLSIGLAVGAKSTSLIYALLIGLLACIWFWRQFSLKGALGRVLLFAATALVPSAFWFGQNWSLFGSPVVPFQLKLGGITLFPGKDPALFDSAQEWVYVTGRKWWVVYPWIEKFTMESGFGWLWTTLLPAALFAGILVWRERDAARRFYLLAIASLLMGSLLVWWKLTHHEPRYMLHVVGLVAIMAAYCLARLQTAARRAALSLIVVGLLGNASMAYRGISARHVSDWVRNDYIGAVSRTPRAMLDHLDRLPSTRIFNEKHGLVESTTVAYALYGSKYQHQLLEDQNLQSASVAEFRDRLKANRIDHLFIIAKEGDPYLERYMPANGFDPSFLTHQDGLVQALYRID